MKHLLAGLFAFYSFSALAGEITFENLPLAKTTVKTIGAPHASRTAEIHVQDKKSALEQLKDHVQNQLGRQVIGAKCEVPRVIFYSSEQGLQSECSVSFL